eukprot:3933579-Rhodomonas_salina.3
MRKRHRSLFLPLFLPPSLLRSICSAYHPRAHCNSRHPPSSAQVCLHFIHVYQPSSRSRQFFLTMPSPPLQPRKSSLCGVRQPACRTSLARCSIPWQLCTSSYLPVSLTWAGRRGDDPPCPHSLAPSARPQLEPPPALTFSSSSESSPPLDTLPPRRQPICAAASPTSY